MCVGCGIKVKKSVIEYTEVSLTLIAIIIAFSFGIIKYFPMLVLKARRLKIGQIGARISISKKGTLWQKLIEDLLTSTGWCF